ncbi:MAG: LysR family transcriptional regulator [Alphaproteobacteria bacterium]|nr:LysR family transcriptional regulator [Alphaproteobacteria bacterium]
MNQFRELSAFVAVAEEEAFNAAARRLKVSPSGVTRLVNAMEERIGARLFTRTTRQVSLTDAGRRLYGEAGRILEQVEQAEALAAGAHQMPSGTLRITAPVLFGQRYLMPIVRDFLDAYPNVSVLAGFHDRVVHILDEGFDVALRIGQLEDTSLYATRVGTARRVVVAAPSYLEAHGIPAKPEDLAPHQIIIPGGIFNREEWAFKARGKPVVARLKPRLTLTSLTAGIDTAIAGWGITRALSYQVADALADGRLVEVLGAWETEEMPVSLVYPEGRQAAAKIRVFVEFAAGRLRAGPGL